MKFMMLNKTYDTIDDAMLAWQAMPLDRQAEVMESAAGHIGDIVQFLIRDKAIGALFLAETFERIQEGAIESDGVLGVQ